MRYNTKHIAYYGLTNRERQILLLLANGESYAQIREALGIKMNTVKSVVNRLRKSFVVFDRISLITTALKMGLLELEK